jgi:hypothetical protein
MPEIVEINLSVCWQDLEDDLESELLPVAAERPRRAIPDSLPRSGGEKGPLCSLRAEDDEYDLFVTASVVWVGPNEIAMAEPVSLTPFGSIGPTLKLGDVIEVVRLDDRTIGYVRLLKRGRIWSRTLHDPGKLALEDTSVQAILDQLIAAGSMWEWCAGNLTIQGLMEEGRTEPSPLHTELMDALTEVLGERKAEPGFGHVTH